MRKLFALVMAVAAIVFVCVAVYIVWFYQRVNLAGCAWLFAGNCAVFVMQLLYNLDRRKR